MKIKSTSWSPAPQEKTEYVPDMSLVKLGLLALVMATLSNALAIYCVVKVLNWQEIISTPLEWGAALALGAVYVVIRSVNNVFFGTRDPSHPPPSNGK